ncbi:hypothetical protein [Paraburkholderia caballeronis]|uniref:hypothetical protein n=1 Tax=Paraburkholderia caballeronis TaxID=416943 RepID=UPI001066DC8C|nr:hypothetical protein [Paraburkholderia caballeronis]
MGTIFCLVALVALVIFVDRACAIRSRNVIGRGRFAIFAIDRLRDRCVDPGCVDVVPAPAFFPLRRTTVAARSGDRAVGRFGRR